MSLFVAALISLVSTLLEKLVLLFDTKYNGTKIPQVTLFIFQGETYQFNH